MFTYVLLIIIIILLIVGVYWYCTKDSRKRKLATVLQSESSGVFDEKARAALLALTEIDHPRADDRHRRGTIMRYNVLDGQLARGAPLDNVVDDFTRVIMGIRDDPIHLGALLDTDFILHDVETFGRDILRELQPNEIDNHLYIGLFEQLATHAPAARDAIINDRAAKAQASAHTTSQAAQLALEDATKFTSDAQNVHDSAVTRDLRTTLAKLKQDGDVDATRAIADAREYINEMDGTTLSSDRRRDALTVLDQIAQAHMIGTYGDTEDRIFAHVWNRCGHPRNASNIALMRDAVITSLADSIEGGSLTCANGRTGRVLGALATLDHDPVVGGAMTYEAYRNQIYGEVKQLISNEVEAHRDSPDADIRAAVEAYEEGQESTTDADKAFRDSLKSKIDNNIDAYNDKLTEAERGNIKKECHVYAAVASL